MEFFSHPHNILRFRAWFFRQIRLFMDGQGFYECDVPVLQKEPNIDQAIVPITVRVKQDKNQSVRYLITSPEYPLKKILAQAFKIGTKQNSPYENNSEKEEDNFNGIYYLGHSFRDFENSPKHLCEFSILEWYARAKPLNFLLENTLSLFAFLNEKISDDPNWRLNVRLFPEKAQVFTLAELWNEVYKTDVDSQQDLFPQVWIKKAQAQKVTPNNTCLQNDPYFFSSFDNKNTLINDEQIELQKFFQCLAFDLDPYLCQFPLAIINEYPEKLALLAAPIEHKPGLVNRLEIFLEGSEIANGALEHNDPNLIGKRLRREIEFFHSNFPKEKPLTFPNQFVLANHNLPECSGIALGVDRLLMYCCQTELITDIYPKGIYD